MDADIDNLLRAVNGWWTAASQTDQRIQEYYSAVATKSAARRHLIDVVETYVNAVAHARSMGLTRRLAGFGFGNEPEHTPGGVASSFAAVATDAYAAVSEGLSAFRAAIRSADEAQVAENAAIAAVNEAITVEQAAQEAMADAFEADPDRFGVAQSAFASAIETAVFASYEPHEAFEVSLTTPPGAWSGFQGTKAFKGIFRYMQNVDLNDAARTAITTDRHLCPEDRASLAQASGNARIAMENIITAAGEAIVGKATFNEARSTAVATLVQTLHEISANLDGSY